MAYLKAEYHVSKTKAIVKVLALSMREAAGIVFALDSTIDSVEAKILGGTAWTKISREKIA